MVKSPNFFLAKKAFPIKNSTLVKFIDFSVKKWRQMTNYVKIDVII